VLVTRRFTFESAHHLPNYPGKCARPHGHGYRLEVSVGGPVRDDGLVMDFHELARIVEDRVIRHLDHKDLNELIEVPSAENIVSWIWRQLGELPVQELRLWETEDSSVTMRESDR
jgi:6-pyruvoyltetrahydropterin/6-carboxytetrahydropterin synthase